MKANNVLIGVVVALVAACACALAVTALAGGLIWAQRTAAATPAATLNPTQQATALDEIQAYVIVQRGLEPEEPVEPKFLTVEEVRQRTIADFEEDYSPEEAADDVRVLAALGLVEPELELYDLLIRLYSEGVAGFYDPDTKELVLVSDAQGLNAYERTVFAHEYTHAMQDQAFGIRASGYSEEMWETDSQRAAAIQAVLEGDASLLEEQYLDTLSTAERREYDAVINDIDVSVYFELPPYLLRDFIFPYEEGLAFVRYFYDRGGWAQVDALWQDPPVSTEHILHPERFEAGDAPLLVPTPALTDTLGSDWRLVDQDVNGEWYTFLILAYGVDAGARLDEDDAREAAEGWGGDGYSVYFNDSTQETVLAAHWTWDTTEDAEQFTAAFRDYADGRWGETSDSGSPACWTGANEVNCLFTAGQDTLWVMAPDPQVLELVASEYGGF